MKEKQVKEAFLGGDVAVLAGVFAVGVVCLFLGDGWNGVGVILLLCGAMMVPFYHHGYRLEGRRGLFRRKEILLSRENKDEILSFLEGETASLDLHPIQKGGALVDVYYQKGDSSMMARYFDYQDFIKDVQYPLHEISPAMVSTLESFAIDKK